MKNKNNAFKVSFAGAGSQYDVSISSDNIQLLSYNVLRSFYAYKDFEIHPAPAIVDKFAEQFFEELPPANLIIPLSIVENWHKLFEGLNISEESHAILC